MNRTANKRKLIFDAFSQQWELLKRYNYLQGIHQKYVGNYICPICLRHFSPKDLNQALPNPLTLEDAPPKELGGKANTLTCKECNNTLGSKVDSHLTVRLKDLDKRNFLSGTEGKVKVVAGDQIVQGTLSVKEDGTIQMFHSDKNNHPQKLEEFIASVGPENEFQVVSIEFSKGNFSPKKLEYAVLKTAYMLVFERFGYAFILDPVYDRLREQLLHPDRDIYPSRFWFQAPYPKESYGVHFITESGLESILIIFEVKTNNTERVLAAILPLPFNNIDAILEELNQRFKSQKRFYIQGSTFDPNADYLRDIEHISHTLNWIETKKGQIGSKFYKFQIIWLIQIITSTSSASNPRLSSRQSSNWRQS